MITYKIYGMHIRNEMIENLKRQLGINNSDVYYDDRPNGGLALYTAKKAWLSPIKHNETHRVVFPDDVEVCNNFTDICEQIVKTHPDAIISLFCWEGRKKSFLLDSLISPYIQSHFVIGAGIIMPTKYIESCFDWIKKTYNDEIADDAAIQYWAENHNIEIITTIPSLVQHLGVNSVLTPDAEVRQSSYFFKNPTADWSNPVVAKICKSNFKPKSKNILKVVNHP